MVERRAQPLVVVTSETPAIAYGRPVSPMFRGALANTSRAITGSTHIHVHPNPEPVWDPSGGYVNPPSAPWDARWSVRDLPNPNDFSAGWYWLGTPSGQDGTLGITSAARQWKPDPGTPHAPAWHSIFPFKPSVVAVDHYLQGGASVHHPKGVNFNSHFLEHMWMEFTNDLHPQPFTWVIAAAVTSWPSANSRHYLLDAGRNPDSVHFPRLQDWQCGTPRTIKDNLDYRTMLAVERNHVLMHTNTSGARYIRARTDAALRPRMFIGIFNGAASYVGAYSPGKQELHRGTVSTGSAYRHRYYVLGRAQNRMDQSHTGHVLVFEIRYWKHALTHVQLQEQYKQLATTYQFDKYRGL